MTINITMTVSAALNVSSTMTRGPSTPPYLNSTTTAPYWPASNTSTSAWLTGTGTGAVSTICTTDLSSTYNITTRGQWVTTGNTTTRATQTPTGGMGMTTTTMASSTDTETSCPREDSTSTATTSSAGTVLSTTDGATFSDSTVTVSLTTVRSSTVTLTSATSSTSTQVIDTAMTPITSASVTSTQTATVTPTKTVCATDAPTGVPTPRNIYCGVHGLPVGTYFLAQFVQNRENVPVTLEGCYQFCHANFEDAGGCRSYDFYLEPGLDVPRCNLYGSNVAYALRSVDNSQPHWWFDAACGDPTDPRWRGGHSSVNDHHVDSFPIWGRGELPLGSP